MKHRGKHLPRRLPSSSPFPHIRIGCLIAIIADTHMPRGARQLPERCVELIRMAEARGTRGYPRYRGSSASATGSRTETNLERGWYVRGSDGRLGVRDRHCRILGADIPLDHPRAPLCTVPRLCRLQPPG